MNLNTIPPSKLNRSIQQASPCFSAQKEDVLPPPARQALHDLVCAVVQSPYNVQEVITALEQQQAPREILPLFQQFSHAHVETARQALADAQRVFNGSILLEPGAGATQKTIPGPPGSSLTTWTWETHDRHITLTKRTESARQHSLTDLTGRSRQDCIVEISPTTTVRRTARPHPPQGPWVSEDILYKNVPSGIKIGTDLNVWVTRSVPGTSHLIMATCSGDLDPRSHHQLVPGSMGQSMTCLFLPAGTNPHGIDLGKAMYTQPSFQVQRTPFQSMTDEPPSYQAVVQKQLFYFDSTSKQWVKSRHKPQEVDALRDLQALV